MNETKNGRVIECIESESPVTRVRIKKGMLVFRYSKNSTEEHRDAIYDAIMAIESGIKPFSPTISIKILDEDDLSTIQLEIGNTESQTKIIKTRGMDY